MSLKKFGAGLILQVVIKIMAAGLGFFTTRWLIENFTEAQYETYVIILAYNAAILMALWLGLPQIIQKYYTNTDTYDELKNFWTTFSILRFASYFLGLIIIFATYRFLEIGQLGFIIGIYSAQFILIADFAYRSVCDALGTAWKFSTTDFLGKLILVIMLFGASYFGYATNYFVYFIIASIIAYTAALTLDTFWHRKYTKHGQFETQIVRDNFKPIVFLTISYISYGLYYTTIPLFLKQFGFDGGIVAGYANAFKFFEIASIVPGLTMPTIASLVKKRMDSEATILRPSWIKNIDFLQNRLRQVVFVEWFIIATGIGFATAAGLFIFGPFAIQLVDPELKYPVAIDAIKVLAFANIPQTMMLYSTVVNLLHDGEKTDMIISIILAITAMIVYTLLIPMFGIYGATGSVIAMFTVDFVLKFGMVYFRVLRVTPEN